MDEEKVKIKIYSDSDDTVSVTSALKQLILKGIPLDFEFPENLKPEENEIIVLQVGSLESKYLKNLIPRNSLIHWNIISDLKVLEMKQDYLN